MVLLCGRGGGSSFAGLSRESMLVGRLEEAGTDGGGVGFAGGCWACGRGA